MKYALALLLALCCGTVSFADEKLLLDQIFAETQPVPADARVTLRLPSTAVIGEEISAVLVVENTGKDEFIISVGGDYRSTGYSQRMKVRVRNAAKELLPELPSEAYGIGGGGFFQQTSIKPGGKHEIPFSLECYVSFPQPGVYSVTAGHDLGWCVDKTRPHPVGTTSLTVTEPTAAQAAEYVRRHFDSQPATPPRDKSDEILREYKLERKLCVLRHSAYLPALRERARAGSVAAVKGIGHMSSPQSTEALMALLNHVSPAVVEAGLRQLARRIPSAEDPKKPAWPGWSQFQIDPLVPTAWTLEFEQPLLTAALKLLSHQETGVVEAAAQVVQTRGKEEHAPALLQALQRSFNVYHTPRSGPETNTLDPPKPQRALMNALDTLRKRGWRAEPPGGEAAAVAWLRQLADKEIPGPNDDDWLQDKRHWMETNNATLKVCVLEALTQPLSNEAADVVRDALDDRDWGVIRVACEVAKRSKRPEFVRPLVQIVETQHENFLQHAAHDAAVACGARTELWEALASNITYQEQMVYTLGSLIRGTIDLPPSNGTGGNSNFSRNQRFAIRDEWREFLQQHRKQLDAGEKILPPDEATAAALTGAVYSPDSPAVVIHFKDGTNWPTVTKQK